MATPRIVPDHLMTGREVTALFGCCMQSVYRWVRQGLLIAVQVRGVGHYERAQVHMLRDSLMTGTGANR